MVGGAAASDPFASRGAAVKFEAVAGVFGAEEFISLTCRSVRMSTLAPGALNKLSTKSFT